MSLWRGNGTNVIKMAPESAIRFFAFEKASSNSDHNNINFNYALFA